MKDHSIYIHIHIMHLCPGMMAAHQSQLIQIYSVDWTDVYDTYNIEHRTEPVSHYSTSGQLILPQRLWLSINSGFLWIQIPSDRTSGTQTHATQMLTFKFVEICSTPLITALGRIYVTVRNWMDLCHFWSVSTGVDWIRTAPPCPLGYPSVGGVR